MSGCTIVCGSREAYQDLTILAFIDEECKVDSGSNVGPNIPQDAPEERPFVMEDPCHLHEPGVYNQLYGTSL